MVIHVVQRGETVYSIAEEYGVSADRLILENEISAPYRLAVGEALVVQFPKETYVVLEGDTLADIAGKNGITVLQLLRNNPYLSDREYIYPGEMLVISYEGDKIGDIATNGFAYPFIDLGVLRKTLPFLTYLTVFSYQVTAEGNINEIDDEDIIRTAKEYGVAPVMMLVASVTDQTEETEVIRTILTSLSIQERFFRNLLRILEEKGYYGVSISTPYIYPRDRTYYDAFVAELTRRVSGAGFKVFDTFSIRVFQLLTGTIFQGLQYPDLGREVDGITLISYEWGYSLGVPPGTVSMETFRRFLGDILEVIPSDKTQIGVSVIGYVWRLPYIPGTSRGMAISYNAAIELALENNAEIQYDDTTNSAYFQYVSADEYVVRFWDARSMNTFAGLVPEFDLNGIGIWNIMTFFPQLWMVINAQYNIRSVL
jgi:spore germination protein